mmetsp:Transcript_31777/g.84833  ORF Transcript_31777/g.84833 Transcript_31777/m.84833 type:complete len:246 (-) Transcript_31777:2520-3257(-)
MYPYEVCTNCTVELQSLNGGTLGHTSITAKEDSASRTLLCNSIHNAVSEAPAQGRRRMHCGNRFARLRWRLQTLPRSAVALLNGSIHCLMHIGVDVAVELKQHAQQTTQLKNIHDGLPDVAQEDANVPRGDLRNDFGHAHARRSIDKGDARHVEHNDLPVAALLQPLLHLFTIRMPQRGLEVKHLHTFHHQCRLCHLNRPVRCGPWNPPKSVHLSVGCSTQDVSQGNRNSEEHAKLDACEERRET